MRTFRYTSGFSNANDRGPVCHKIPRALMARSSDKISNILKLCGSSTCRLLPLVSSGNLLLINGILIARWWEGGINWKGNVEYAGRCNLFKFIKKSFDVTSRCQFG